MTVRQAMHCKASVRFEYHAASVSSVQQMYVDVTRESPSNRLTHQ